MVDRVRLGERNRVGVGDSGTGESFADAANLDDQTCPAIRSVDPVSGISTLSTSSIFRLEVL